MGEMRGIMNLCVPFNSIEPLSNKLSADSWSSYKSRPISTEEQTFMETNLSKAKVNLSAELVKMKLSSQELMSLSVGDVIMTEQETKQGITFLVEGKPLFKGQAGAFKGHKAIQVGEPIQRASELLSVTPKENSEAGKPE